MKIFLFISAIFNLTFGYFVADIKRIIRYHNCDPECIFHYYELNSSTVNFFPNCEKVCGFLRLDEKTDLSENEMKVVFGEMKILNGGIRIENSNLRNLSIFEENLEFGCQTHGLLIRNNSQLEDAWIITNLTYMDGRSFKKCEIQVLQNPKLNSAELCEHPTLSSFLDMKTSGNLEDCGCQGGQISENSSSQFSDCTNILGGLEIWNFSNSLGTLQSFSNIAHIHGNLKIRNSNFQNLSFFESLESVKVENMGLEETVVFELRENPKMTRFGISSLKEFSNIHEGYLIGNFQNLHPNFCLTIDEMRFFLESRMVFMNLEAKFCNLEDSGASVDPEDVKICEFPNMADLDSDCSYIFGNLKIDFGDQKYVGKLGKISHIFGTLTVENTDFEDLGFLSSLEFIGSLDESSPVIQIVSNKKLKSAFFPNLKSIITRGEFYAVIHYNHPKLGNIKNLGDFKIFDIKWIPPISFYGGDWGCPTSKSTILDPSFFETCSTLIHGLEISSPSIPQYINNLKNVKTLIGGLEISNTNLESLSFLEKLETLKSSNGSILEGININIHDNREMKQLGWTNLKTINFPYTNTINLENLHPDFCISLQEMTVFLDANANFLNLHARFCDFESEFQIPAKKVCKFSTMRSLSSDCVHIFGDLSIESGDEEHVEKLRSVTHIFGTLSIFHTDLRNLDFLGALRRMANLNESLPLIRIINNKSLKNVELPKMNGSISKDYPVSIIEENDIFQSSKYCMKFQYNTRTNVSYNGANCRGYTMTSNGRKNSFVLIFFSILHYASN